MSGNLAKSGTHQLALTAETYDRILCGTVQTRAGQYPLQPVETQIFQVVVQASNANAVGSVVYVGSEIDGCHIELVTGASITIPINDLNKVYIRGSAVGLDVNYLAVV